MSEYGAKPKTEHKPLEGGDMQFCYVTARGALWKAVRALEELRAHEVPRPWVYEWLDTAIDDAEVAMAALDKEYR